MISGGNMIVRSFLTCRCRMQVLILIFAEALGLYGLIISIILSSLSTNYVQ